MAIAKGTGILVSAVLFLVYIEVVACLQCYSCPASKTENECVTISACGSDEVCMLRRTTDNDTQEILYESRCETQSECDRELTRYQTILTALVGRKREIKQVLLGDVCLIQCCDNDLCNSGCIKPSDLPFTVPTTATPSNISPIPTASTRPPIPTASTRPPIPTASTRPPLPTQSTRPPLPVFVTSLQTFVTSLPTFILSLHTSVTPSPTFVTKLETSNIDNKLSTQGGKLTYLTSKGELLIPTKPHKTSTKLTSIRTTMPSTNSTISSGTTASNALSSTSASPSLITSKSPNQANISIINTNRTTGHSAQTSSRISSPSSSRLPTVATVSSATISAPVCPDGSVAFENSCYFFVRHEMSFRDAENFCAKYQSHLVHVDTAKENEFLKKQLINLRRGPTQFWIGITDDDTESVWKFYDNQKLANFFDWSPGEPDGKQAFDGNAQADCAVFDPFLNFQWRDEDCSPYQYSVPICEIGN